MLEARILQSNVIRLMTGVPLEPSMSKQFYFTNQSEREAYFNSKTVITITDSKYIRADYIQIDKSQSDLFNINYMCFINTVVGEPPIYAYVTKTQYVNMHCTRIYFEVDVWSTYMFNIRLHDCDIAREHPPVGYQYNYNTVPEGVPYGDHRIVNNYKIDLDSSEEYIIVSACDLLQSAGSVDNPVIIGAKGDVVGGIPTACNVYAVTNGTSSLYNIMSSLSQYPWVSQSIISIFPYPISALGHSVTTVQSAMGFSIGILFERNAVVKNYSLNWRSMFPSYHESKLYTYPYSYIEISGGNGASIILKPELLTSSTLSLNVWGAVTEGSLMCHAEGYANSKDQQFASVLFSGIPSIPVQNNQYLIAKAQAVSQNDLAHSIAKDNIFFNAVAGAVSGVLSGNVGGAFGSMIQGFTNAYHEQQSAEQDRLSISQQQSAVGLAGKGASGAGLIMYARRELDFNVRFWTVTNEWADRLDKYFSAFGLKSQMVKTPNVKTRPRYNYIRCNTVNIEGDCEVEAIDKIRSMFLNGVTFWHDLNNVGVYGNNG